jgi:pyridoxamine 5'-phosphate oxidase family protein
MAVMVLELNTAERDCLLGERLGRLASIDAHGQPQNNPFGFYLNDELGVIDIGGRAMGQTKKFRNVRSHPLVSLVVDDLASVRPWHVRGVEIRGHAERSATGSRPTRTTPAKPSESTQPRSSLGDSTRTNCQRRWLR